MRVNDAVSGALFILLAICLIGVASTFPALPGQPYGAALFPTVIGTGFAICGVLLVIRGLAAAGRQKPPFTLDPLLHVPHNAISLGMVVGAVVIYIFLADWIGFIPIAFLLLVGMFMWLGTRLLPALVTAALFTGVTFWFFANVLRVPLPRGLLTGII